MSGLSWSLGKSTADRRKIRHNLPLDTGMEDAVVRDDRARIAGFDGETAARYHDARVEATFVGNDVVQELIGVVNRDGLAGARVNGGGNEDVVLQHAIGNRAAAAAE